MDHSKKAQRFKSHYDEWAQALFRFIYFRSNDKALSQDIVQDTFVKYWDKIDTVSEGKEKSYLFTIARNLLYNTIEHKKIVDQYASTNPQRGGQQSPHYELEVNEFKQRLEKAIEDLPDKQREVFLLHRIEGYKYKEISELLDLSQKAVEKRMSQALQELRKVYSKL